MKRNRIVERLARSLKGIHVVLLRFLLVGTTLLAISTSTLAASQPVAAASAAYGATATKAHTYVFPVQPASVARYGPYHHDYPATDIFCPVGSKFVAPTNGVVDYVSRVDRWDPRIDDPSTRGGLSVAVIGDDGVRYYGSHLSGVEKGIVPGVRVRAGQPLGRTGKTGDAKYTAAHLHFGISHPTSPYDWKVRRGEISPYRYLLAWQAHRDVKPVLLAATPR
jgi:murein DD-endopeptidase MepM/ murein hydrolase activator NlpD